MGSLVAVAISIALVAFVLKLFARAAAVDRSGRPTRAETFLTAAAPVLHGNPVDRTSAASVRAASPLGADDETPPPPTAPAADATAAMMATLTGPGLCTPVEPAR